jgi:FkbH-like protein
MKLIEALELLNRPTEAGAQTLSVTLATGFAPLHLRTFLRAELAVACPGSSVVVRAGTFDDLLGNVERAGRAETGAIAVVIEWADLDPRLGLRRAGSWLPDDLDEIVEEALRRLTELEHALLAATVAAPVACATPTLALPPLFIQRPIQNGVHALRLREAVSSFARRCAEHPLVSVSSAEQLDRLSRPEDRRDVAAELATGFPYALHHASVLAAQLAALIAPGSAKKGLITDLDNTLWAGTVGEVGADALTWDLDDGTRRHGLYQQLLASLAAAGVLIGVATRNDPDVAVAALSRADLLIDPRVVYPVTAGWGPKSVSIERILDVWNVSADAVVYVDDSPLDLAEAVAALPGLHAAAFPHSDASIVPFLEGLRALFAKATVTTEDRIRLASVRSARAFRAAEADSEKRLTDFLARAGGTLELCRGPSARARAIELINKTNQFNLNGRRLDAAAVAAVVDNGASQLITAAYSDRFGPLGIVAALLVAVEQHALQIEQWVMSCRAFSRRIEHHCLRYLFDTFGVEQITLAFRDTGRNAPLRAFLRTLAGEEPNGRVAVTLDAFNEGHPALVHRVVEVDS